MYVSENFFKKLEGLEPYLKDVITSLMDEIESKISVQSDFSELKYIVKELANDQKETKKELKELAEAQKETKKELKELAEAQKEIKKELKELAEAQKETKKELKELAEAQKELSEAQKETKKELKELANDQKETKKELKELAEAQKELAEAQKRTELKIEELRKETKKELKDIKKQVGGLAMDVGYGIEDKIIPYIHDFGKKEFGIDVTLVDRRNIVYSDGNYDEVNIYAEGTKNGHPSFVIGECKAQPGKKDFDKFSQMAESEKKTVTGDVFPFIVGYHFTPDTESYAKRKYPHIRIYKTFEFELKYSKGR